MPADLEASLRKIESVKAGTYDPRTEHVDNQGNTLFINRLIREDSPYLLQHAHNPVNWYPWGSEAFETAERESKPVFLSIGYSTCHWCHVMEVESFDNVEVAKLLNQDFIAIKMDREQYPDIDEFYMTGVQLMTGQGGWPMSNFLFPDGKPFFGGTYFPPPTFINLLQQVSAAWRDKNAELLTSSRSIDQSIGRLLSEQQSAQPLATDAWQRFTSAVLRREDATLGGLAGAPKFPQEPLLLGMLHVASTALSESDYAFVTRALDGMACGGLFDQVGGGFHRYSVDAHWLVPHFEKMLYNQSQLGLVYLRVWQLSGDEFFKRVCVRTLDYVLRDMQHPAGGFYSATDADSEGEEGTFFLWRIEELEAVLTKSEFAFFSVLFEVSKDGNFENANILNLRRRLQISSGELQILDAILAKLYEEREKRIHPIRDDKIIVAWTGAMIHTLAEAAYAFNNAIWLEAAEDAARRLLASNVTENFRLHRILMNDTVSIDGQLEDYANFSLGLITLFDVTGTPDYLQSAASLLNSAWEQFWDSEAEVLYLSAQAKGGPQLARSRSAGDGATISPVATTVSCLNKLAQRAALLNREYGSIWQSRASRVCNSIYADVNENPLSHPSMLCAITELREGDFSTIQYAGGGVCRVRLWAAKEDDVHCHIMAEIEIQPGYFILQSESGDYQAVEFSIIPTGGAWRTAEVNIPLPMQQFKMGHEQLTGYVDKFAVSLRAVRDNVEVNPALSSRMLRVQLKLQICSDNECLLPESVEIDVPVSGANI